MNERLNSIRHGNLRKPQTPDFELEELLKNGPLRKIEHVLHREQKRRLLRWSAANPGSLSSLDGSWTDGQINFYHRQKKLERKQVEQIFNRWLELSRS